MVHDPVEQGHDKYNSFLSSMFILRADASGTEMLILLLSSYQLACVSIRANTKPKARRYARPKGGH